MFKSQSEPTAAGHSSSTTTAPKLIAPGLGGSDEVVGWTTYMIDYALTQHVVAILTENTTKNR